MRLTYLSGSSIPSRDANSVQVMAMCTAFASRGLQVELIARRGQERADDIFAFYGVQPSFTVLRSRAAARPPLGGFLLPAFAFNATRRFRPGLLYARHLPSLWATSFLGTPFVVEVHLPPSRTDHVLLASLMRRSNFRRLVVISRALEREYRRLYPRLEADQVVVAHDATFEPRSQTVDLPLDLPSKGEALRVGYSGHLYPGKGMELLASLSRRLPEFEFHVVGGSEHDLDLWQSRCERQENLMLHGYLPPAQIAAFHAAMDILIAPYESTVLGASSQRNLAGWMSPLKIFEYMSARRPMVVSDLPVLREVLVHEETALLVTPGDLGEWEHALRRLVDPGLRRRLSDLAFESFRAHHTWARRASTVLAGLA